MLRAATKQNVFAALDETYFGASNFVIEYGDGKPLWLRITFVPNTNFVFTVEKATLGTSFFQVTEAPGVKLLVADHQVTQSFETAVFRIQSWALRIKEEVIEGNPISRELQAVRKQLDARIDSLAESQEEFFTQAEAEQLAKKLSEFTDKLEEIAKSNAELTDTVLGLAKKLQELADASTEVNKGTWLRMASSRLLNATKVVLGSKEAREFALEAAKKVLLEGPK